MQLTKFSLLTCISLVIRKYKGNYCYASQERFLGLLEEFHGIKIKVRALNKHLADLRSEGFIKSHKRSHRNDDGTLCLQTSATCLTIKGYSLLVAEGVEWCKNKLFALKKKYMTWFEKKAEQEKQAAARPCATGKDSLKEIIKQAKNEGKSLYDKLLNART